MKAATNIKKGWTVLVCEKCGSVWGYDEKDCYPGTCPGCLPEPPTFESCLCPACHAPSVEITETQEQAAGKRVFWCANPKCCIGQWSATTKPVESASPQLEAQNELNMLQGAMLLLFSKYKKKTGWEVVSARTKTDLVKQTDSEGFMRQVPGLRDLKLYAEGQVADGKMRISTF